MEGNILSYFISIDSALLLVAAIESIIEVIDHIPSRQEASLQLPLEHLFIGLNQLLAFQINFI